MAYKIDSAWERGQTITAERLNHMENGIAAALGAIGDAFGKEYTDGSREYTVGLDKLSNKPIDAGAITGTTLKATDTESENALDIAGVSALKGNVNIGGALTVGQNETGKTKDTTLNGKLSVTGLSDLKNELDVTGISNLKGGLNVGIASANKDATIYGELTVEGATKAVTWDENNNATSFAKKAATLNGLVNITGDSTINGDLTVGSEQNRTTIKLNDAMTVKFSNNKNQIIIDGYTKINESFQIGDENNNKTAYIYGPLSIMEFNSSTHRPTASIILSKDTRITAETLIINTETTSLLGTTTIAKLDKLIVGDADTASNIENKIYGTTTIYNTLQIGTYGPQDFWPNPEEPRIEQFGVQGDLKIFSDIEIGLTGNEDGIGTKQLVNTNTRIHGNTTIDNLTVNTLNTGIYINQDVPNQDYGLIVEKNTLLNDMIVFVNNSTQKGFKLQVQETTPSTNLIIEPYSIGNKDSNLQFKNSNLILTSEKVLKINETSLSEDDIKHLHTLWTNYQTQNGGETS